MKQYSNEDGEVLVLSNDEYETLSQLLFIACYQSFDDINISDNMVELYENFK